MTRSKERLIMPNAAGLNNKLDSFQRLISLFTPGVIFIQESKAKRKGLIKADNYVIFEQLRKSSGGGGLLTAVHHNLSPVSINDEKDDILVVQAKVGTKSVRLINAYGPQENSSEDITNEFFNNLDTEVKKSKLAGAMVCMEMDANSKLGSTIIPNDPNEQSDNGEKLEKFVVENDLIVVNSEELCSGTITRYRKTVKSEEKSVLDYFIVCRQFYNLVIKMTIDEERKYCLTKYSTKTGSKSCKESDHNPLFLEIKISWNSLFQDEHKRIEIYNFKNPDCFQKFQEMTENCKELVDCFDDVENFDDAASKWLKVLNDIIRKCFKKIRVNRYKKNERLEKLFTEREEAKELIAKLTNTDSFDKVEELTETVDEISEKISDICSEKNKDIVKEVIGIYDDSIEGFSHIKAWEMKKRLAPKNTLDPPAAKKDKHGNLVTGRD